MTRIIRDTELDGALEDAAGILAAAGHEITDAMVADLVRQAAGGDISVAEMLKLIGEHLEQ